MFRPLCCEGTMSGGGKTVCKGRMGSKIVTEVDPGELEALETKLQKVNNSPQVFSIV